MTPSHDKLVFIAPPETAICRVYLAPCTFVPVSATECKLVHEHRKKGK